MADIRDWSQTASSNTDLFPEGMAPSAVNDGMRTVQAEIAQLNADMGGTLTLGGTATAYTLTLNTAPAALSDGLNFWATANATNTGGATTLTVTNASSTAFASKKIKVYVSGAEGDPPAKSIIADNHYLFQYDSAADSGTGAYILLNPSSVDGLYAAAWGSSGATVNIPLPTVAYDYVEVTLTNCKPVTNAVSLNMRVSTNGGSSYATGASDYRYAYRGLTDAGGANDLSSAGVNAILLTGALSNLSGFDGHITIRIPNPAGTTSRKLMHIESHYLHSSSAYFFLTGIAAYNAGTSALTHLQLLMSAGDIASINYTVRAVRM